MACCGALDTLEHIKRAVSTNARPFRTPTNIVREVDGVVVVSDFDSAGRAAVMTVTTSIASKY
jgi:hypothetical protein